MIGLRLRKTGTIPVRLCEGLFPRAMLQAFHSQDCAFVGSIHDVQRNLGEPEVDSDQPRLNASLSQALCRDQHASPRARTRTSSVKLTQRTTLAEEGREAMRLLRKFLKKYPQQNPNELIFRSRRNTPVLETNVLHDGLHPALRALGLPKGGLHAFRRGCNQRWELSGLNPAVLRQQMGHSSEKMTALYTGQIPLEEVKAAFSKAQLSSKSGNKIVVSENVENESAA